VRAQDRKVEELNMYHRQYYSHHFIVIIIVILFAQCKETICQCKFSSEKLSASKACH